MKRVTQEKVNLAGIRAGVCILQLEPRYWRVLDELHTDLQRACETAQDYYRVNHDGSTVSFTLTPERIVVECRTHQLLSTLILASLAASASETRLTVVICDNNRPPKHLHLKVCKGEISEAVYAA